jgi:uncharacterized protein YdeI (YjbR/CyaY-like superfamily)
MKQINLPDGKIHKLPTDLRDKILNSNAASIAWFDITPLARNEFICWVESAKLMETRKRRIDIAISKLEHGQRRPCCWPGCPHRIKNGH